MEYVNLGRTGLRVSRLCLGTMTFGSTAWRPWILPEDASRPFIRHALDVGINFFDTADMYSRGVSEEIVGRALDDFTTRDQVVIATKAFFPMGDGPNDRGLSRKHLFDAIDASLRRLGTDYVDLYQIHRFDPHTPIEETLEALNDIVRGGKARYIGASSMYAWQFARMLQVSERHGWARFVSMQNHYNLVYREEEREMLPLCRAEGIGIIPWSPLARGFLAGNRERDREGRRREEGRRDAAGEDRRVRPVALLRRFGLPRRRPGGRDRPRARGDARADRPGLDPPPAGSDGPDHRGHEDRAARRRRRGTRRRRSTTRSAGRLEEPYVPHPVLGAPVAEAVELEASRSDDVNRPTSAGTIAATAIRRDVVAGGERPPDEPGFQLGEVFVKTSRREMKRR